MSFINTVIFSTLEYRNLLIALILFIFIGSLVIVCIKMVVLLREQGVTATGKNSVLNDLSVPRLKMTRVHIPFSFKLLESSGEQSYEEIKFTVSSEVNYVLQVYWAVSIRDLHISLWRPWTELAHMIKSDINHNNNDNNNNNTDNIIDSKNCELMALNVRQTGPHDERTVTIKTPKPPIALGSPPRLAYPLVIFIIKDVDDDLIHPNETVVLINIVHVKDVVCTLPTSLLAQYLKQANGQLSCLKQLYLAGGDTLTENTNYHPPSLSLAEPVTCTGTGVTLLCSDGPQLEQLCVVCQYFPLSRALLPCRHTCICAICFSKLERCPICRASISSYFCIRNEEYIPNGTIETTPLNRNKQTIHWLDALNDKLTDFLGFR